MKTMRKLTVLFTALALMLTYLCVPIQATTVTEPTLATEPTEGILPAVDTEVSATEEEIPADSELPAAPEEEALPTEATESVLAEVQPVVQFQEMNAAIVDQGTCGDNLTWTRDSDGVLTISGVGEMTDYQFGSRNPPWVQNINITQIVVEEGVTHIGKEAFIHMNNVVSVELPETLTSIGSYAFKRCVALKEINLPTGLQDIGSYAFESCAELSRIEIPAGITAIYSDTFRGCSVLTEVVLHEGLMAIHSNAFYGTNLTSITIPNSVTTIGSRAFQSCSFKEITLPSNITSLGEQAFQHGEVEEITFLGNPPAFHDDSFAGVNGFVRFSEANSTWTTEVRKDYGGKVTWVDHSHVHNLLEVTVAPTCDSMGYSGLECTLCGGRCRGVYTGTLLHDLIGATCTKPVRCQREGCTYTEGNPLGHSWKDPFASPLVCSVCEITDTHQHSFDETITEPTCTEQGYTTFVCKLCNYTYVGNYINTPGHTPGEPSCSTGAICDVCGEVCEEPVPHVYKSEWNQGDIYGHWHDCINCDAHAASEDHIPNVEFATNKTSKYCTICGFVIEEQRDYSSVTVVAKGLWDGGPVSWKITSDGVLTITGKTHIQAHQSYIWKDYADIITRIVISDGITNVPEDGFSGMQNVTSVYLGNKVKEIEKYAFRNCKKLNEITIPASVEVIGHSAFADCNSLVSLSFAEGSKLTTIYDYAFSGTGITQLTTPTSLKTIKGYAFKDCTALRNLYLTDGLEELTYYAFAGCTGMTNLYVPESIKSMGGHVFDNTVSLEKLEWYDNAGATFPDRKALKHVVLSGAASHVYSFAFQNCSALEEVVFGPNITQIDSSVFENCSGQTIIFLGDAPAFHDYSFRGTTAKAEYPGSNPTWTADKLQNYGGNITWVNSEHIYVSETVVPNCTEQGYTIHTCSDCGKVKIDSYVDALGHTGGTATCISLAVCERCENTYGEKDMTNHGTTELQNAQDSSCTTNGYSGDLYCLDCSNVASPGQVIPASHTYTTTVIPATYTKTGYTEYICIDCGDTYQDSFIKANGLPKPTVTATANVVSGGVHLTWEDDGEADFYKVYRATSKKGKYKHIATVEAAEAKVSVGVGKKYYFKVMAVCEDNSKLNSGYSSVVSFTGKCAQPVVSITQNTGGKPYLKWSKVTSAKKYYVYRVDEVTGALTSLGSTTKTYFTDNKAVVGTTYCYQVRAYPSKSAYRSAYSETVSCLCICGQPAVSISISSATGKPSLSWKAISGAVSYDIYRATSADGPFELLVNQTGVTFSDTTAAPETNYWYKVNALGAQEALNSVDGVAKKAYATLARPDVTFSIDSKTGKPKLSWDAVDGATSYKIYRSSYSKKKYKAIKTVTDTEFLDTSVKVAKGYYYKVIAIGENSKSAYSSYKKLTAKCAQPQVTATQNSAGKPYLTWGKVSGAKKYYVYRVDENGSRTSLGTTTKTYFADKKAALGTTYTYQVRAYGSKSAYKGAYSESVSCLCICSQPTVTVSVVAATGKPTLSWKAIPGAVSYEIYRSENDGEYAKVSAQTATSYTDEAAILDSKYSYKVIAIAQNPEWNSAESAAKSIYCACGNPTITGTRNGKKPMVSWEPVEGATKYYVYRSTKKSSGYKKVATVEGESYTDKKAKKGTTYYYKVIAVSENTSSAYSNYAKIKSK